MCLRHDLEIVLGPEIADLQLAQADDAERGRLHAPDADDAARARRQSVFVAVRVSDRLKI